MCQWVWCKIHKQKAKANQNPSQVGCYMFIGLLVGILICADLKGNKLLSVHLHLFRSSQTFTPPLHMYRGSYIVSIQAQQPCYPWISSSPITRLTRECDLSYLLYCLFIFSICFPLLLILFHSFPVCPHSLPLTFVSSSPSLFLTSSPADFFFFYCSFSHISSCCSKSLKATELVDVIAMVIKALTTPHGLLR